MSDTELVPLGWFRNHRKGDRQGREAIYILTSETSQKQIHLGMCVGRFKSYSGVIE